MGLSQEGAKVFVTGPIFHQHGQESAILHRQVRADDRTYALLSAGDRKPLGPVNTVAIEQGNGGQSELGYPRGELLGGRSAAEKTEGAAGMKFNVGHVAAPQPRVVAAVCDRRMARRMEMVRRLVIVAAWVRRS